jgi:hypothetical protein
MESKAAIVAGGGWRERRDCRVKFKAVACLVLSVQALAFSDNLADHVGAWSVCIPAVLITAAAILFWFERPAMFWGIPDARWRDLEGAPFGNTGPDNTDKRSGLEGTAKPVPEYDIRNLY